MKKYLVIATVFPVAAALILGLVLRFTAAVDNAQAPYAAALKAETAGDYPSALAAIEQALAAAPGHAEFAWRKASYLNALGDPVSAAEWYRFSFSLEPDPSVAFCAADLLAGMAQYEEAEYYAHYVVSSTPGYVRGLRLLAEIELALWNIDNARWCLDRLAANGGDPGVLPAELTRRQTAIGRGLSTLPTTAWFRLFLKTGTIVLTGDEGETGRGEAVFTPLDRAALHVLCLRAASLLAAYGIRPAAVIAAADDPETVLLTDVCAALFSIPYADSNDAPSGVVLLCMANYRDTDDLLQTWNDLNARGCRPYFWAAGISPAAVRACRVPPDFAGTTGAVIFEAVTGAEVIAAPVGPDPDPEETEARYTDWQDGLRLKAPR